MVPVIDRCLTRNPEGPSIFEWYAIPSLYMWCEKRLDAAHGWDVIDGILVLYDPVVGTHPAILSACLQGALIPCGPPPYLSQIYNLPYGAKRRALLLDYIKSSIRVEIVGPYEHLWVNDPDIMVLLKNKKLYIINESGQLATAARRALRGQQKYLASIPPRVPFPTPMSNYLTRIRASTYRKIPWRKDAATLQLLRVSQVY